MPKHLEFSSMSWPVIAMDRLRIDPAMSAALQAAGAEVVAIPGLTPHCCVRRSDCHLAVAGIEIIKPQPNQADYIHNPYVELARTGEKSKDRRIERAAAEPDGSSSHAAQARRSRRRRSGGKRSHTALERTNTDFPNLDCAALHLRAILKELPADALPNTRWISFPTSRCSRQNLAHSLRFGISSLNPVSLTWRQTRMAVEIP